jgi:hypothetical protein
MKLPGYLAIGCLGLFLIGFIGMWLIGSAIFDTGDYVPVEARIVSVEPLCKIGSEWVRAAPHRGFSGPQQRSGTMPCEAARARVAGQPRDGDARAFPVNHVTYAYVSPVDGRSHQGMLDLEQRFDNGDVITITQGPWSWFRDRDHSPPADPADIDAYHPRPGAPLHALAHKTQADVSMFRNE